MTVPPKFRRVDLKANLDAPVDERPAYVLIDNKVYDVRGFLPHHPGNAA
jgi:cytochrome b involved in lipid metabolism